MWEFGCVPFPNPMEVNRTFDVVQLAQFFSEGLIVFDYGTHWAQIAWLGSIEFDLLNVRLVFSGPNLPYCIFIVRGCFSKVILLLSIFSCMHVLSGFYIVWLSLIGFGSRTQSNSHSFWFVHLCWISNCVLRLSLIELELIGQFDLFINKPQNSRMKKLKLKSKFYSNTVLQFLAAGNLNQMS